MKKKIVTLLLIAVMAFTGACFIAPEANIAEAAESTDVSFIAESKSISEYRSQSGYTYPKPTTQGKEDWIFAGWYKEQSCTTPYTEETIVGVTDAWAKYVPAEVLSVKCQVTAGTDAYSEKTDMRFLTTVDSTLYSEVGFEITSNSKTFSFPSTTVFKRINSAIDGLECGFSPVAFDVESEYFMTFTITDILNKYFDRLHFVRPYWVTMDGTTVYGICRNARVSDSYNKIANIPVRLYSDATLSAGSLQVAYDSTKFEYLEYEVGNVDAGATAVNSTDNTYVTCNVSDQVNQKPDGMLVNLRFKIIGDVTSNTTFTVTNNSVSDSSSSANIPVFNSIYKTYVVAYDGTNADTSWYDEFASDSTRTKFTIATVADLYGFAELVNGGNNFTGKTIYLAADITVNTGDALNWNASGATYTWTPIGSFALARTFNGTFDGQGQSISGLYFRSDARGLGLFGFTGAGSLIQNVELENTYFCATATTEVEMGAIAGRSFGSIHNVYVADDVYLDCYGYYCGGIAGYNQYGKNKAYSNCWFDGNIDMQTTGRWGGGIIGYLHKDATKFDMSHCLFSGTLTTAWNNGGAQVGGLVGCTAVSMDVSDCLITGSVTSTGNQFAFGAVFGSTTANTTLTIDNVYEDNATSKYTVGNSADDAGGTAAKITTYENTDLLGYNGYKNLKNLGIYTLDNTASTNNWVMRSGDVPALKYWVKDWIDVSWYEAATSGSDTFIINTVEELYGFAELSQTIDFKGDTVKLGADIEVNRGDARKWNTDTPGRAWIPAAKSTTFAGTFDGNGKTISGLYVNETSAFSGLFGMVSGTIKDFSLTNSYVNSTAACTAGVAGFSSGNISNVYSDAIVTGTSECGGIVGRYGGTSTATISGCWYAGTVTASGRYCGGMVGCIATGTKTITNCLVTGNVKSTLDVPFAGGLCGAVHAHMGGTANGVITDSLSVGKVRTATTNGTGSVLGRATAGNTVTFDKVYTTDDSCYGDSETATAKTMVGVGDYTYATVTGTPIKKTATELTGANGYKNTMLSFELTNGDGGTWVAIANGTPELAYFSDGTVSNLASVLQVHTDWYYNNKSGVVNVYNITTVADLYGFAQLVNAGVSFSDATVNLQTNLTVNSGDASKWASVAPNYEWIPIGSLTGGKSFNGIFDGDGHSISGLYFRSGNQGLGLFGFTGGNSVIQNVKLENSYFCATNSVAPSNHLGGVQMGAISGRSLGTIKNVYVTDSVYLDCYGYYCGGIAGYNPFGTDKTYSNCWFDGHIDMQTTGRAGGGIIGNVSVATLSLKNCLFTGTITTANKDAGPWVGGLIGQVGAAVSLTDCLSGGKVTSTGSPYTYGSVFGYTAKVAISLTDVYEADDDCPYVIGNNGDNGTKTGSIITRDRYSLLGYGGYYELGSVFDFTNTWIAVQGSVPQLKGWGQTALDLTAGSIDTTWSGAGTSESPYLITSVNELFGLATMAKSTDYTGKHFKLTQSLAVNSGDSDTWNKNVSGIKYPWTPIGRNTATPFSGIFDGNNCTISGLYTDSKTGAWIGLFGKTGTGFAVRNVALTNSYLSCGTGVSGIAYIGSIVGECYGSVDNVYSDATIVSAGKDCGGIVGRINGTNTKSFGRCWYNGNITTSGNQCGGLIGDVIMGTLNMTNCVNTGVVKSIYTVTNNEQPRVGALIGIAWEPSSDTIINITDTIAAGTVSEQCYAGGIGTIAGYTSGAVELNYNDVYACQDTYGYAIGRTSDSTVITGVVIPSSKTDRFIGYCDDATENDGLDFTNIWAVRSEAGVPVIANFASVAGITTVATGNLNTQTGLDSLGLSLANAENYGEGNYLLTVADDSSATKHNTYKSALERLGLSVYVDNVSALGTGGVYNRILKNSDNSLTVNLTYVARKRTTYISISSGKPLSSHLMPLTSTSNKYNVSFAMLPVYEPEDTLALGNAFVMQLKNGHFIVNDGGYALNDNIVVEYMQSKVSAGETPIVDAWFLSHLHGDHSMIFNGLRADKDLRESIRIEGIYFSMPNNDVIYNTDTAISGTEHCAAMIEAMKAGMQMMTTSDDKTTPLYRVQTGQRYYFDGVNVDVVLAQEQLPKGTYDDKVVTAAGEFNTTSTSLLFTTDTNQKIFVAGDINNVNTDYIMSAYGANCPTILSDINVFVAAHHGRNTVNAFTNWLKPNASKFDYVLFPTSETMSVVGSGDIDRIDTNANKTLCNKANNAYSYSDGLSTILTFTSSGITATR